MHGEAVGVGVERESKGVEGVPRGKVSVEGDPGVPG